MIIIVIVTISFILNVTGDFPDLHALPQPCSLKNKTDSDKIEPDDTTTTTTNNNNNNYNKSNNNKSSNNAHLNNNVHETVFVLIHIF